MQDDEDVIEGLEGDDVDASLIIAGRRGASRRGRATFSASDFKNMPAAGSDSD